MDMTKQQIRKFIKEKREELERMAQNRFSGRITREEQQRYIEIYQAIGHKSSTVCFTCGRSAQLMAAQLLRWNEDNQPKKRK